jgi:uncharacterized protein DUF4383
VRRAGYDVRCSGYPITMTRQQVVRYGVVAVGLGYLVLACAGFVAISDNTTHVGGGLYGGNSPDLLWGVFGVNTAMNFIHVIFGALTIAAGVFLHRSPAAAWCVVAGFTILFGYGVTAILLNKGTTSLAITWGVNVLHLATAVVVAGAILLVKSASRHSPALSRQ